MIGRDRPRPLPFRFPAIFVALCLAVQPLRPGIAMTDGPTRPPDDRSNAPPVEWRDADLSFRGTAQVAATLPGGTLVLADGRQIRLAGIALPRRPLSLAADQAWPIEAEAEAALAGLCLGQSVRLYQAGRVRDRYGRLLVQAVREDGRWLQGGLLARGLARVETTPDSQEPLQAMLAAESFARRAELGLWVMDAYRVRRPAEAEAWIDSVQLVEGRVTAVRRGKDGLFVAFGGKGRHAFSVLLPFAVWTEWAGMPTLREETERVASSSFRPSNPSDLIGQRLRVRGWIGKGRSAEIRISHAGQVEWIAPSQKWRVPPFKRTGREDAGRQSRENRDGTRP